MTQFPVDIILPVWNSPEETRSCLVSLAAHSPQARIILVDNGSERETERLLEEFAEILGDRALLVRTDVNLGFVKAANRGLARGEAEFLAVVQSSTQVTAGWLDPLLSLMASEGDVGLATPRLSPLSPGKVPGGDPSSPPQEIDHVSFSALVLRKSVYDAVGGFDEAMDADTWCLKDYSRRVWRAGMRSVAVSSPPVLFKTPTPMGSLERRQARVSQSAALYRERWGDELRFCLVVPVGTDAVALSERLPLLLDGARQGHNLTVILPSRMYKDVNLARDRRHSNLTWSPLSALFFTRRLRERLSSLRSKAPETLLVRWGEVPDALLPEDSMTFSTFSEMINRKLDLYYGR